MTTWRVMTWNIRGAHLPNLDPIADVVREMRPDVVALQETRRTQSTGLAMRLGWNQTWARKHYPFTPFLRWTAEGLALLSPHSLAHVRHESITPGVSTWTYRHRVLLAADIERPGDEFGRLRIYDTHLAAHRHPDDRIEQARRVADRVATDDAPLRVVAGDLNAPGELEVIREFHRAGLRDPGGGPTNPSRAPRQRLDYVLVPDTSRVTDQWESGGGDTWAASSDHVPVVVEFEV